MPAEKPTMPRRPEDSVGIKQMTILLNAGYPLSDKLRVAISELVAAVARAARRQAWDWEQKGDEKR